MNATSVRHDETIVAVASAPGGAARGIVRCSGHAALECVRRRFEPADPAAWPPQSAAAVEGRLKVSGFSVPVPCTALIWPGARSYTRAPTVELHLPGSPPLLEAATAALCEAGARPARPGEFTMRAFLAGRIDLVEAEGVLGVVEADDRRRLDEALRQMAGGLSRSLGRVREELVDLAAHLEAGLDFADEDIEFIGREELTAGIAQIEKEVGALSAQMEARSEAADFVRVALVGPPNAGKSSLFNALAGSERAIVSPAAGTTRDYLTVRLPLGGVTCELIDTAGVEGPIGGEIDETASPASIEEAARRATAGRAAAAEIRLLCRAAGGADADGLSEADLGMADRGMAAGRTTLIVRTKADLAPSAGAEPTPGELAVSAVTGQGLAELRERIGRAAVEAVGGSGDVVATTAARCRDSLRRAAEALADARREAAGRSDELVAAALRAALDELGQVVGTIYTDDILDRVFSRFCIGK